MSSVPTNPVARRSLISWSASSGVMHPTINLANTRNPGDVLLTVLTQSRRTLKLVKSLDEKKAISIISNLDERSAKAYDGDELRAGHHDKGQPDKISASNTGGSKRRYSNHRARERKRQLFLGRGTRLKEAACWLELEP